MDWKDTELHKFVRVASVDDDILNLTNKKPQKQLSQKQLQEKQDIKFLFQKIDLDKKQQKKLNILSFEEC